MGSTVCAAAVIELFVSAGAGAQEWRATRVWVCGGDDAAWVVAAADSTGSPLPEVRFWHAGRGDDPALPSQDHFLPPISGNPLRVAADSSALRVLFADLTAYDYFADRPLSPGPSWRDHCRAAPLAWCGDASEPVCWALVESAALATPTTTAAEDSPAVPATRSEESGSRLALLQLRREVWGLAAEPRLADDGRRFWMASRGGTLHLFWEESDQIHHSTLDDGKWSQRQTVAPAADLAEAWCGATSDGPVFLAGRRVEGDRVQPVAYLRREGDWTSAGAAREGNEFIRLIADRSHVAVVQGRLGIVRLDDAGSVEFGLCELDSSTPVRFSTLSLLRPDSEADAQWRDAVQMALLLGLMTIVLWSRRRQVAAPVVLPEGWVLAAVWRRTLAAALDFAPIVLSISVWMARQPDNLLRQIQSTTVQEMLADPELQDKLSPLVPVLLITYGLWCLVSELIMATTPGKFLFGCRVISVTGGRPSARQVIARNVVRVLMVSMGFSGLIVTLMMIVMVSRNRQRIGDLLAHTLVVEHAPVREAERPGAGGDKPPSEPYD